METLPLTPPSKQEAGKRQNSTRKKEDLKQTKYQRIQIIAQLAVLIFFTSKLKGLSNLSGHSPHQKKPIVHVTTKSNQATSQPQCSETSLSVAGASNGYQPPVRAMVNIVLYYRVSTSRTAACVKSGTCPRPPVAPSLTETWGGRASRNATCQSHHNHN